MSDDLHAATLKDRLDLVEKLNHVGAQNGISVKFSRNDDLTSNIRVQKGDKLFLVRADHVMYAGDLVNQFEYYFSSTLPELRDNLQVVDYSKPGWHRLKTGGRMFYTSFAEDVGATEDYLAYLRPMPGETVLDVGSYCGYSVLAFSRAVGPSGRVYAFEPDPDNFSALEKNVGEAKVGNVVLRNAALSSTTGPLLFSSEGNMGSSIVEKTSARAATVEVRSERLQSLFESGEIASFDVAKIDIEGAEYALLEDCVDVIRKTRARWAVELHANPVTGQGIDVERVRSIFDHLGYVSYLQPASSIAAAPTLFALRDDRFPAAPGQSAEGSDTRRFRELTEALAKQSKAYTEMELAHNRRKGSFGHRLKFLFDGK